MDAPAPPTLGPENLGPEIDTAIVRMLEEGKICDDAELQTWASRTFANTVIITDGFVDSFRRLIAQRKNPTVSHSAKSE